jgi:hypothetical protein
VKLGTVVRGALSLLLAVAAPILTPSPSLAQDEEAAVVASCQPGGGLWRSDDNMSDPPVAGMAPIPRPPNTSTYIWSCDVDGHRLVVKHQAHVSYHGDCGGSVQGFMAAWVDGAKVADGAYLDGACYVDDHTWVASVRLDPKGRLTICRGLAPGRAPRCKTTTAPDALSAQFDPTYILPEYRTTPGMELRYAAAELCASLTTRLVLTPTAGDADGSFRTEAVAGTEGWGNAPDDGPALEASFDLDNDGRPDEVSLIPVLKLHGPQRVGLTWRGAGAVSEPFTAKELTRSVRDLPALTEGQHYVADGVQPVRIGGRTYVYLRERDVRDDGDDIIDATQGATLMGASTITRGLIELHSDGSSTLVCAWGPRLRPEEFL